MNRSLKKMVYKKTSDAKIDYALLKNLIQLVDFSISKSLLKFEKDELLGVYNVLDKKGVVKETGKHFHITDYYLFACVFYKKIKKSRSFHFDIDFSAFSYIYWAFIEDVFKGNSSSVYSDLEKAVWSHAIIEFSELGESDFLDYIESLDLEKDKKEAFAFFYGFVEAIEVVNLPPQRFLDVSNSLLSLFSHDDSFLYAKNELLMAIKAKAIGDYDFALSCFFVLKEHPEYIRDLFIPIVSALYEKERKGFFDEHLKCAEELKTVPEKIISALSLVSVGSDEDVQVYMDVFKKVKTLTPKSSRLLFKIISFEELSPKSDCIKTCFGELNALLAEDNDKVIFNIISELNRLDDFKKWKRKLVINFIKQSHFQIEKYLRGIDQVIWLSKDFVLFEKVVVELVNRFHFNKLINHLDHSIRFFLNKEKEKFDEFVICLLINDKAIFRLIGHEIFNEISVNGYNFGKDISLLKPIRQYKLWVSILQDYREPKYVLPCLIPIIYSKSSFVKEAFIGKIEEYAESYGSVLNVLKEKLDLNSDYEKKIYDRIRAHLTEVNKEHIQEKRNIKELNPFYTQNFLFQSFSKLYKRSFNRKLEGYSKENSIMNLFSHVTLLKGGGWKVQGSNNVSKLSAIETSFSLPIFYFSEPEHFDYLKTIEMSRDWTDDFKIVEKMIEDEQQ